MTHDTLGEFLNPSFTTAKFGEGRDGTVVVPGSAEAGGYHHRLSKNRITVRSFIIVCRLSIPPPHLPPDRQGPRSNAVGSLLIDDEQAVRESIRQVLTRTVLRSLPLTTDYGVRAYLRTSTDVLSSTSHPRSRRPLQSSRRFGPAISKAEYPALTGGCQLLAARYSLIPW